MLNPGSLNPVSELCSRYNPKLTPEPGFPHGKGGYWASGSGFLVKASWRRLESFSKKWAPVKWGELGLAYTLAMRGDPKTCKGLGTVSSMPECPETNADCVVVTFAQRRHGMSSCLAPNAPGEDFKMSSGAILEVDRPDFLQEPCLFQSCHFSKLRQKVN